MSGLIGKKLGMTSVYDDNGAQIPVTVVEVEPNVITQIKTIEKDGYNAVQLSAFEKRAKSTIRSEEGHFSKVGTTPKLVTKEFRGFIPEGLVEGDELKVTDLFSENTGVNVVGTSKGKGFAGVVKRHGFRGVGDRTHGQHNRQRAPGSIGMASDPARVFKGLKMAGRMGNDRVKVKRLRIVRIIADSNLLLIKGAVPGRKGSYLEIHNT